jgi:hypothetical protein
MPVGTNAERWAHIRQLQLLMSSGMNDWEAMQAFQKQREQNGDQPLTRNMMQRRMKQAHSDWGRVSKQSLEEVRRRAIANRMRAQRLALTRTKPIVVNNVVERHADPDLPAYIKACEGLEEIHGLTDARRAETMRLVVTAMFHELMDILREEVRDQGELVRVATRLRAVMESGSRVVVKGELVEPASMMIEAKANVIVKTDPGTNGTNGTGGTNGSSGHA